MDDCVAAGIGADRLRLVPLGVHADRATPAQIAAATVMANGVTVDAGMADRTNPKHEARYRDAVKEASDVMGAAGLDVLLEPINSRDMPGYFLNDFDQAARIVDDLGLSRLGIQFDLWHAARIHGDADAVWAWHRDRVNHIQIAGFPSRNEPGGGGFDLTGLCSALDESGWDGFVAAEYIPARATVHGLLWLQALKGRSRPIGG